MFPLYILVIPKRAGIDTSALDYDPHVVSPSTRVCCPYTHLFAYACLLIGRRSDCISGGCH
jgi:hypothetical protein